MRFLLCIVLSFPILLIFSCQSEPDDLLNPSLDCKVVKAYEYQSGGTIHDSIAYTYTNDKITKVEYLSDHSFYTLDYNGDRIVKKNYFFNGSATSDGYDIMSYTPDGTLNEVNTYFDFLGSVTHLQKISLTYTMDKLTKLTTYFIDQNNQAQMEREDLFTYTGGNVTKYVNKSYAFGTLDRTDSSAMEYDNLPNYYRKQGSQFLLTDPFYNLDADGVVFALSQNNLIKGRTLPNGDWVTLTYTPDEKGNLSTVSVDGEIGIRYFYKCP